MDTTTTTPTTAATRRVTGLIGNRLVLAGALLYFAEWVAIIGADGMDVWFAPGTDPAKVLAGYAGNGNAFAWAAGWLGVVLTGRILFAAALQHGLRRSGHDDPLALFAVLVATVGVVFEAITCAVVAGVAVAADHGADASLVTGLDTVAGALENLIWGALGISVLAMTSAMFRSRLFPRTLCAVGLVAGVPLTLVGLAFGSPAQSDVAEALQVGTPLMWVWTLWTGVVMWRAGSARAQNSFDQTLTA
jgi:hypothetical protein